MKKIFLSIMTATFVCAGATAQELNLSEKGYQHRVAAGALMEAVQTDDGYTDVVREYKKVLLYDPGTPEAIFNIGLVYAHHARKTSSFYSYWDEMGNIIYKGKFSNDKPVGAYPSK